MTYDDTWMQLRDYEAKPYLPITIKDRDSVSVEPNFKVSPSENKTVDAPDQRKSLDVLEQRLLGYLNDQGIDESTVGFVYKNLINEEVLLLNEDEVFVAASTMKVPINMAVYDLVAEGILDLSDYYTVYENNLEGGTGVLQYEPVGQSYSLRELLMYSIRESDNVATNVLYAIMNNTNGEYLLDTLHRVYGVSSYNGNNITPGEAAQIMEHLYYQSDDPYYATLLDDMKHTVYNGYFTNTFNEATLAHKTGDFEGYYNDIGIVYAKEPFIFSIYTAYLENPEVVLSDIGEIVYEWHTGSR